MKLEPLLYVTDLKASVKFYCRLPGFALGEYYPDELHATYASILIDGYKLRLVLGGKRLPPFHKHGLCGSGVQLYIQVPDVDAIYGGLQADQALVEDIEDKIWGDREFTIADPDGYLISFYTQ